MYSDYGTFGMVLGVHSIVRWLLIGLGVLVSVRAWLGRLAGRSWTPADTRFGRAFVACLDLQAFVGVLLYGVFSPVVAAGMSNLAIATRSRAFRFWMLEHPVAMVVALALAHVGLAKARRADGPVAHRHAALFFTLAIVVILAAIPWPIFTFGRAMWPRR
jgi:hypothetical protein